MRQYLAMKEHDYADNYHFGEGPNWRLRAAKRALTYIGMDPKLLCHGIKREVYMSKLAENAIQVLKGEELKPIFSDLRSVSEVSEMAKERWIIRRSKEKPDYEEWNREEIKTLIMQGNLDHEVSPHLFTIEHKLEE
jgi:hypothetical protein